MNKRFKLLITGLLAFLTVSLNVFAREMKIDDLSKEIEKVNADAQSAYIIGDYVFTTGHPLSTQDIMLAARSIDVKDKNGKTESDNIYGEMTIHEIIKVYDPKNLTSLGWFASNNSDGDTPLDKETVLNIKYIDYQRVEEETKFDVSLNINKQGYKDVLTGYKFDESFDLEPSEKKYSKDLELKNNKLTGLVRMNSKVDNKVFPDETRTGFYVPVVITIPNANSDTTVKVKNWWGEKEFNYNSLDVHEEKESALVLLLSLNKDADEKKTTITVDLDGEKQVYGDKVYEIDWTEVVFESSLYETIKKESKPDTDVNFSQVPSDTNGQGVLTINTTLLSKYPIYYYRGKVDNNVIYNNMCWQIVRTTDTGSIKLIYNGKPNNGKCNNVNKDSAYSTSSDQKFSYNTNGSWPSFAGYTVPSNLTYNKLYSEGGLAIAMEGSSADKYDSARYGSDVEYKDGKYTLTDPIEIDKSLFGAKDNPYIGNKYKKITWDGSGPQIEWKTITEGNIEEARSLVKTHPYVCIPEKYDYMNPETTECAEVYYIVQADDIYNSGNAKSGIIYYYKFKKGEKYSEDIKESFNGHDNATKSQAKINVDSFYANNIETNSKAVALIDTKAQYCNSRKVEDWNIFSASNTALKTKTKNRNGALISYSLLYKNFADLLDGKTPTLECDEADTYSTDLGDEFYYPVGVLSADEANYAGVVFNVNDSSESNTYLNTGVNYWLMTPAYYGDIKSYNPLNIMTINKSGKFTNTVATMNSDVYLKPVITLKGSATYSDGNGTIEKPYVIVE